MRNDGTTVYKNSSFCIYLYNLSMPIEGVCVCVDRFTIFSKRVSVQTSIIWTRRLLVTCQIFSSIFSFSTGMRKEKYV